MIKFKKFITDEIKYHMDNNIPLGSLYRVGSEMYYKTFRDARNLFLENKIELSDVDLHLVVETNIGEFATYNGEHVPLDSPMEYPIEEEENKPLNKPKRGGNKKYYVYVKDPSTGNTKKVSFGDPSGKLQSKISNPEARKSYAARHDCANQKDKTKAGYWSCNLPRYADSLGLSGGGNFYW